MNSAAIIALVKIVASFVETLTSNAQVAYAITVLEAWLPTIIEEVPELVEDVQQIIATLKGSDILTPDQVATVEAMSATADAAADAALAAAQAEGAAT
jgi:hypothetical protein